MIVDVNAYYGSWPYWALRNCDVESMLRKMDKYGIERAFVSSLKAVFADVEAGNNEILELVSRHPDRFSPAFTYSPYAHKRERFRSDLASHRPCLVKLHPLNHSYDLLEEPFIAELLDCCGEEGVPVMIPRRLMMSWRLPLLDLKAIDTLAKNHPDTNFILASVNYLFEYQTSLDLMRRHPNVFIETSAMMAHREIETTVAEVGAGRILHGSCNPLQNPAIGPLKIRSAEISEEEKRRILSLNAIELFRLTDVGERS